MFKKHWNIKGVPNLGITLNQCELAPVRSLLKVFGVTQRKNLMRSKFGFKSRKPAINLYWSPEEQFLFISSLKIHYFTFQTLSSFIIVIKYLLNKQKKVYTVNMFTHCLYLYSLKSKLADYSNLITNWLKGRQQCEKLLVLQGFKYIMYEFFKKWVALTE